MTLEQAEFVLAHEDWWTPGTVVRARRVLWNWRRFCEADFVWSRRFRL